MRPAHCRSTFLLSLFRQRLIFCWIKVSTEADTCRKFILPKLYDAGWSDEHICEQRAFTDGRIIVRGNKAGRRAGKRVDYLLRFTRDLPLAVVEAKAEYKKAADGLQQAKDYARILDLKFAYATNGHEIIECDFLTGIETVLDAFPSPDSLWSRLRGAENLASADLPPRQRERNHRQIRRSRPTPRCRQSTAGPALCRVTKRLKDEERFAQLLHHRGLMGPGRRHLRRGFSPAMRAAAISSMPI